MQLYIKLLDNKPIDHPITRENMLTAYPTVDLDNLPDSWAEFVRVPPPNIGPYEVKEVFYEWVGDVIKDVWYVYPMSPEEKTATQNRRKQAWIDSGGPANWIFDEEKCCYNPPVPMPQDGKLYMWVQMASQWVEIPAPVVTAHNRPTYPTDGKLYDYNENTNSWVLRP